MDELGIDSTDNANGTYETQHDTPDEVIKKHSETMERVQDQVDRWRRKTATDVLDTETSQKALQSQTHCLFKFMYYH